MALFGKKKSQLESLMEAYNSLSDEEKAKFLDILNGNEPTEDEVVDETTEDTAPAEEQVSEDNIETAEEDVTTDEAPVEETENVEEETAPTEEVAPVEDETPVEEPIDEEQVEAEEKAEEDVEEAENAKLDAFFEEWAVYKAKIDSLFDRLEETDKPAETVGLGKQRAVEEDTDDDNLSAHEYAMKYATR